MTIILPEDITDNIRFEMMEKVAERMLMGENATNIAKSLKIPRKEVIALQQEYRMVLTQDNEARDLARDYLHQMVEHYTKLIKKFYDLVDEIEILDFNHQVAAQKNAALKAIAELEAKRVDALQKAGLLESAELGDEIAQWEEEKETMLSVLRDLCPNCQSQVGSRLTALRGGIVAERPDDIEVEVVENA